MFDKTLIVITLRIYLNSFWFALRQTMKSWNIVLLQAILLIPLAFLPFLLRPIGGFAASLIMGFALAYYLSIYLALLRHGLDDEKVDKSSLLNEAGVHFSSAISVLFLFFVIRMTADLLGNHFIRTAIDILMAVFLNPIPEIIYQRGGSISDILRDSFEFVRDNGLEWFIPMLIPFFLIYGFSSATLFAALSINPIYSLEMLLFSLSQALFNPVFIFLLIVILYILFFVMLFRGHMYKNLLSGRRQRLYREKMG